ncbi:MAG: hypothetical protein ACRCXD_16005, partial [Luteolibacter sp.]
MAKELDPFYLPESSITWAIKHLDKFGDTDIFPIPVEFRALSKNASHVAKELSQRDLAKHQYSVPRRT